MSVAVLAAFAGSSCHLLDAGDQFRAHRASRQLQSGMTLAQVFGVLEAAGKSGDWPGILAGFGCSLRGEKRTWVLSRAGKGYLVITHLEDTPFGGHGDWKQAEYADVTGVATFLSEAESGRCAAYQSNFGRWAFALEVGEGRVRSVGSVEYQPAD